MQVPANAAIRQMQISFTSYYNSGWVSIDDVAVRKLGTAIVRKYYYAGGERVGMRSSDGGLAWILSDHLGSTGKVVRASDYVTLAEMRYKPWGETRYTSGMSRTNRQYTGQISEPDLGLYFYQSRFYDPALGRFISADSIVPGAYNPLDWDRYAYVRNNPVKFVDPSGHAQKCADGDNCASAFQGRPKETITKSGKEVYDLYLRYNTTAGWWNDNGKNSLPLADFLGMMILFELDTEYGQKELLTELVSRQLWIDDEKRMARPAWCKGETCVLGVFNWLGAYSQSAMGRVPTNSAWRDRPNNPSQNIMEDANDIGRNALFVSAQYHVYNGDAPLHWGNREDVWNVSSGRSFGPLSYEIYYRGQSGNFTIYSWNQYHDMGFEK